MKFGGYRVLPSSLRSTSVRRSPLKKVPNKGAIPVQEQEGSLEHKIDKLFSGQDLLFERLDSEPKWSSRAYHKAKSGAKSAGIFVRKQPLAAKLVIAVVPALVLGSLVALSWGNGSDRGSISQVAGVSDKNSTTTEGESPKGVAKDVVPSFEMVLPKGKTESQIKFALVSPEGNAPVYAFLDMIGSTQIKISEQELPEQFKSNRDAELDRVAKSFQATDIIQIDDVKVYHGLSDKLKTQSLVFIKNDRLIFIASPVKLADDEWAGYIVNLN